MCSSSDAVNTFHSGASRQLDLIDRYLYDFINGVKDNVGVLIDTGNLLNSHTYFPIFKQEENSSKFQFDNLNESAKESLHVFTSMHKRHNEYVEVFAGFPNGNFATSIEGSTVPAHYDSSQRGWYTTGRDSPSDITLINAYLSTSGETVISAVGKVRDPRGEFIGVVGIDVSLKNLSDMVRKLNFDRTGQFIIFEQTGRILCDSKHVENIGKFIDKDITNAAFSTFKSAPDGALEVVYDKVPVRAMLRTTQCGWKVVALQAQAEIMEHSNRAIVRFIMICSAIALALIGLGLFIAWSINNPLKRLVTAMNAVAEGDYHAVPPARGFYKELLILRDALAKMVGANEKALNLAQEKSKEAEEAVETAKQATARAEEAAHLAEQAKSDGMHAAAMQLEGVVNDISQTASELTSQINNAHQDAAKSSQQLTDAATAMNQMNATVQEVAKNASFAAEMSTSTKNNAESGQKILENAMSSVFQVQKVSLELKNDMEKLSEHTQSITKIMSVISDIADQTNLLALNAAIEAARAGDAGRGFAVVADEVRKLAEKTMASTNDVAGAVNSITESAQQSVTRMNVALGEVEKATSLATESGNALKQIILNVEQTADQVRTIATASEEQSVASEQINKSISVVNDMSAETTRAMDGAAADIRELAEQTARLTKLVTQMKKE